MELVPRFGRDRELKASSDGHTASLGHTVIVSVNLGLYHSIMEKLVPLLEKEKGALDFNVLAAT